MERTGIRQTAAPEARSIGGPYGNGPYRETACEPNRKVVDSLSEITATLHQLTEGNGLKIDWDTLTRLSSEAKSAADGGDFCTAIKRYCEGIRTAMQQIRQRETADVG